MKTLLLQHDIAWERKAENHAHVERLLATAKPSPGTLVVLAELFDTGFSMHLDRIVDDSTIDWARRIAEQHRVRILVGHAEIGADGRGRNCATIVDGLVDGEPVVLGTYRKVHPFSHGLEHEHYSGGDRLLVVDVGGVSIAPLICYDLRFPELWRLAARAGAEVFVIGASWPAARQEHWRALCIARAIENQAFVLAVNRIGEDPTIRYVGGSIVIGPRGDVLAETGADEAVLPVTIDIDALRAWRARFPALADMRDALLGSIPVDRDTTMRRDADESAPTR